MKSRIIRLSIAVFGISLFIAACNTNQTRQSLSGDPYLRPDAIAEFGPEAEYWAKENFDLQRLSYLLERSDNLEEFESYLNDENGINNLDLNGDGYADYISVEEFADRGSHERGLSLYCRYGPDLIQELATVHFYRDDQYAPGARVLVRGDEYLYGDNYYYETNWLDRTIQLVSLLFTDRDRYYRSPYYYNYYPADYVVYEVVETPDYITRIEQLYPEPAFVYVPAPTIISNFSIESPHRGQRLDRIYARAANPTREHLEFIGSEPARAVRFARADRGTGKDASFNLNDGAKFERRVERENLKTARRFERENLKAARHFERENLKAVRRVERENAKAARRDGRENIRDVRRVERSNARAAGPPVHVANRKMNAPRPAHVPKPNVRMTGPPAVRMSGPPAVRRRGGPPMMQNSGKGQGRVHVQSHSPARVHVQAQAPGRGQGQSKGEGQGRGGGKGKKPLGRSGTRSLAR